MSTLNIPILYRRSKRPLNYHHLLPDLAPWIARTTHVSNKFLWSNDVRAIEARLYLQSNVWKKVVCDMQCENKTLCQRSNHISPTGDVNVVDYADGPWKHWLRCFLVKVPIHSIINACMTAQTSTINVGVLGRRRSMKKNCLLSISTQYDYCRGPLYKITGHNKMFSRMLMKSVRIADNRWRRWRITQFLIFDNIRAVKSGW